MLKEHERRLIREPAGLVGEIGLHAIGQLPASPPPPQFMIRTGPVKRGADRTRLAGETKLASLLPSFDDVGEFGAGGFPDIGIS